MKFGTVRGLANGHVLPQLGALWSWVPVMPRGDIHQSFTDALVIPSHGIVWGIYSLLCLCLYGYGFRIGGKR